MSPPSRERVALRSPHDPRDAADVTRLAGAAGPVPGSGWSVALLDVLFLAAVLVVGIAFSLVLMVLG